MIADDDNWTASLFATIDAKDAAGFVGFLAEDAVFRYGNHPEVSGRAAIRDAVASFFGAIAALRHTVSAQWQTDGAIIAVGEVAYTRHDGSTLTVPFADVLRMRGGKIGDYRIYIDASQLFATGD
jgi:ketosteroid isomerase-like protein